MQIAVFKSKMNETKARRMEILAIWADMGFDTEGLCEMTLFPEDGMDFK